MASKPSKTTNRLHFTDLEPTRFEDLCLALIYPLHPWIDIQHYGRMGGDGGVDIYAKERIEDGEDRDWYVQCRRYSKATASTLRSAVDDALEHAPKTPDVLLLVFACDVRRSAHESYIKYAASKGVSTPLLWTASVLEVSLYTARRDLLFSYFGVSAAAEARHRQATISRNISLKKRLRKELIKTPKEIDWEKARRWPPEKLLDSEVIIHSIDDTSYPDIDEKPSGISGWFKLEMWDFYHNGLEFVIRINCGIINEQGGWAVINYDQKFDETEYQRTDMVRLGRIPYRNIVDVDIIGDEYYPQPHIYCRFADGGQPYEGFRYVLLSDRYPLPLDPEFQFEFKA